MLIDRNLTIRQPIQVVWDTIVADFPNTVSLIPGVEKVEMISDNTYHIVVKGKVAFISATFDLKTTITNLQPPTHMETVTEGKAIGGLGRVGQRQSMDLRPISENETEAVYKAEVSLAGRLATLGNKVFRAKVDQMADIFINAFLEKCQRDGDVR